MKMFDKEFMDRTAALVAAMPDWLKGTPFNVREPAPITSCEIDCPECHGTGKVKVELTKNV